MPSDLEAALREAREEIAIQRCHYAVSTAAWERSGKLLDRIDAALSAASVEASGGAQCEICEGTGKAFNAIDMEWSACLYCGGTGLPRNRPAPSEAPNVEPQPRTYWHRFRHYSGGDIWMEQGVYNGQRPIETIPLYDKAALDSARAEGIAAMRECAAKVAHDGRVPKCGYYTGEELVCVNIAAAIREAKP